jgi:HD-GYP domain-containing protein (c-di-GMP phosphodiesterase class II)
VGERALSEEEALADMRAGAGTLFDPECVEALEHHLAAATAATAADE